MCTAQQKKVIPTCVAHRFYEHREDHEDAGTRLDPAAKHWSTLACKISF